MAHVEAGKIRIGLLGYGSLGQYLCEKIIASDELELAFVWNRTPEKVVEAVEAGTLPEGVHLLDIGAAESFKADIIAEVSHPAVAQQHGEAILKFAHFYVGSPTAFANQAWDEAMRHAVRAGSKSVYIPVGALWGATDIQRMAESGSLKELSVTMKKHPKSLKLAAELDVPVVSGQENIIYEGSVRKLAPLAPNNVNTMACAAIASGDALGFDGVQARLVADDRLDAHVIVVDVKGPGGFHVETVRYNPAVTGAVTGQLTYASFFSSLLQVARLQTAAASIRFC